MGLRELKAARTRKHIIDVAYEMFLADGYDQTTMEQIAERAEVGSSTLYRYFPSKELLILDQLSVTLDLGGALRARPADEPLEISLGMALRHSFDSVGDDERFSAIRRIIDVSPVPRARLWDIVVGSRGDLEQAIAERLGRPVDDLLVLMTAATTYSVLEIAGERIWAADATASHLDALDGVLTEMRALDRILPAPLAVLEAAAR
jgi:AcrR family transcriptional regulator